MRAEPVNILSGEVSVEHEDFTLPGRIPIHWQRTYTSGNNRAGLCGHGWETPADIRLETDPASSEVTMVLPADGPLFFDRLPAAQGTDAAELELMDGARLSDLGDEFQVRTKEDRIYHFPKNLARITGAGVTEYTIARISDLCGNWLAFERQSGSLVSIRESAGRYLRPHLDNGRIHKISMKLPGTDKEHVFVQYRYDDKGDLMAVLDTLDNPYTFAYDCHHMVRHTDRNGLSFYYEYEDPAEDKWRVIHTWGDGGLYDYKFQYIDDLSERRITDSLGHVSTVKLSEVSLPISEIDPLGGMTIFEYDDRGRTTAVVDPDQHRTEYVYDERGNLLELVRPDGHTVATEFDDQNKATQITDPNGAAWRQEWDDRGLLVRQTTPLGAESKYEYDDRGQLVGFTNPRGGRTGLFFDAYGNLTGLANALNHETRFAYDHLGNVNGKTDPLGQRATYAYDGKGRLTSSTLPSGATIACAYDPEDNLVRYVDENGAETRLEYAGLGEIRRRIQPDGHSVEYHYDTEERLTGVTNQRGECYHLVRDPLGRIVVEIDYWGQSRRYAYSAAGYLTRSTDPLARTIQYDTDPLGRITQKILPDPKDPEAFQTESFEYDPNGNMVACENAAIRIARAFDAEGRLVEERQGDSAILTNTYDPNGKRLTRSIDLTLGGETYNNTIGYGYDLLDQAIGVTPQEYDSLHFERDALGQLIREQLGTQIQRDLAYSPDGYLTAQSVLANEQPLFEQQFRYDPAGNLVEKKDSALGTDRFTYDPLGRLLFHVDPQGKITQYLNDPAGDRLQTRISEHPSDEAGPLQWHRDGRYEGVFYQFDRAGNLVVRKDADKTIHLQWDANQRLVESVTNDTPTHYQYDPLGRRVAKTTGSNATRFFWDGDALAGDALVEETPTGPSPPSQVREWVYFPETFEPLALLCTPTAEERALFLYHNAPNGCPTRMLDKDGEVVWAAQYDGWGGIERLLVNRVDNPIRLQGQYEDVETKNYYNLHRYYDPFVGQFISQDLLGLLSGYNFYSYAANTIGWIDPKGLSCKKTFYSVQNTADAARLARGGEPWPTGLSRANLGPGFYAWGSRADAESYLRRLEQQGATDLQIVAYEIAEGDLARLTTKDLTSLSDEAVDEFMDQYSHYGRALPHDYQHIIRNTGIGAPEHYFSPDAFGLFGPG